MKKINILHVVGKMNRGGAETFLMNILRNIDTKKFTFIFLCYGEEKFDYEDEIISLGGIIIRTPDVKKVGPYRHIRNVLQIIKDKEIDIVHAHTYFNSMFSLFAAKRAGVKTRITHSHTTNSEYRPNPVKRTYFAISKFIVNKYSTDYFACGKEAGDALFYKNNRFTIVDNGIILDDFYFNKTMRRQLRRELNIPEDATVIGHVGRIDMQKNQTFIIDVFVEYMKINTNSYLLLVGDGILRSEIEDKVKHLNIQESVLFLGKRGDVNRLYNIMDLFLFPSLKEGLPVTLVEAQANGLVCLISDTIDKAIKLTSCIHFHPLSQDSKLWVQKINTLSLERIDTKRILNDGPYNMVDNIKTIESLYTKLSNKMESV